MRRSVQAGMVITLCSWGWAEAEPDWPTMPYTAHENYQAVDSQGRGTFPTTSTIRVEGVILNRPADMLDGTPGSDPFMGGQWQIFVQATEPDDSGGTSLYMGQNIGKIVGNHPDGSYTDSEWLTELERLNRDPATGRLFRPGDLVEVRARAPGLFFRGKTNINEQHQKTPEADFDVVLLQADYGLPAPQLVSLSALKDAADQFIFDPTRTSGAELYQGDCLELQNVQFVTGTWGTEQTMSIRDDTGRTLPVLLGRGSGFSRYEAPAGPFNIIGILDQEDIDESDGYKAGYRLWVMDYDGSVFVLYRYVKPDFDRDGDVDDEDSLHFEACASGPTVPQTDPDCLNADFDGDSDVDQKDFSVLQRCWSGPEGLADPDCDQ